MMKIYDVLIVGAGVVGCAAARELTRRGADVALVERCADVGLETSCRNSGVLHSGINYKPGSLRAKLSVRGNAMMDEICADLGVPIKRIGKLTVALSKEDIPGMERLREQGIANGVPGMEVLDLDGMRRVQPGVDGVAALYTPSSAIIDPFGLTEALASNAMANGAEIFLEREVVSISREDHESGEKIFAVETDRSGSREIFRARTVVNSAGLRADEVSKMAGVDATTIWACRGEYYVLDKRVGSQLSALVYPVPGPRDPGLGIHLTPTVDGNVLIGPSADYIPDEAREDHRATRSVMASLRREGLRLMPGLSAGDFIRNFAGNRPKHTPPEVGGNADFLIDAKTMRGFIRLEGIESPGLTSSPAIAELVADLVGEVVELRPKKNFDARAGRRPPRFAALSLEEQRDLVASDPDYGEVVCRCERITKREIRDAIEDPIRARTLASVKYRTRATMGRCQGGFCTPKIVRILRDEYGYRPEDFFGASGLGAWMFSGEVRGDVR